MTYVITGPCTGVKDKTCAGECPVEAIVCEDDVPGRGPSSPARTRSSSPARLPQAAPPRPGPLPDDTDHVASYVTSR